MIRNGFFTLMQASFFIAYVVTSGWTSLLSSELFRLTPLMRSYFKRVFAGKAGDEFEVPSIPYHSDIPKILFFGLLGVTYFFLAPLILPFLLVYFSMGYIIYRNQVSGMPSFLNIQVILSLMSFTHPSSSLIYVAPKKKGPSLIEEERKKSKFFTCTFHDATHLDLPILLHA